jgi:hypothetical protein
MPLTRELAGSSPVLATHRQPNCNELSLYPYLNWLNGRVRQAPDLYSSITSLIHDLKRGNPGTHAISKITLFIRTDQKQALAP